MSGRDHTIRLLADRTDSSMHYEPAISALTVLTQGNHDPDADEETQYEGPAMFVGEVIEGGNPGGSKSGVSGDVFLPGVELDVRQGSDSLIYPHEGGPVQYGTYIQSSGVGGGLGMGGGHGGVAGLVKGSYDEDGSVDEESKGDSHPTIPRKTYLTIWIIFWLLGMYLWLLVE